MRNLNEVAAECMTALDALNIPYREVERFEVETRAKSRWGQCRMLMGGKFVISILEDLLSEDVPIASLKETIIHELIHTCVGCMNHKAKWKFYVDKVNRALGYDIKRTATASEKGVTGIVRKRKVNHKFVCEKCGQEVTRERDRGFAAAYTCGKCGGNFVKLF